MHDRHEPTRPPLNGRRRVPRQPVPVLSFKGWCDAWGDEVEAMVEARIAAGTLPAGSVAALEAELRTSGSEASELVRAAAGQRLDPHLVATRLVELLLGRVL